MLLLRAARPGWRAELDAGSDGVCDARFAGAHPRQLATAAPHRLRTLVWTLQGGDAPLALQVRRPRPRPCALGSHGARRH